MSKFGPSGAVLHHQPVAQSPVPTGRWKRVSAILALTCRGYLPITTRNKFAGSAEAFRAAIRPSQFYGGGNRGEDSFSARAFALTEAALAFILARVSC